MIRSFAIGALVVLAVAVFPDSAAAVFGPVRPIDPASAPNDSLESTIYSNGSPKIAGDGLGNWIAVWASVEVANGVSLSPAGEGDLVSAYSLDGGETWSGPLLVDDEAATRSARDVEIGVHDTTWITVWGDAEEGGVRAARSTDGGVTWNVAQTLTTDTVRHAVVGADGLGTWITAWIREASGDYYVEICRSTDDGQTWTLPQTAYLDPFPSNHLRFAADTSGSWVMTWVHDFQIATMSSLDSGLTWSTPLTIGLASVFSPSMPDIATDDDGRWILVWDVDLPVTGESVEDDDEDVVVSASDDIGGTWSTPFPLQGANAVVAGTHSKEQYIAYDGSGGWHVVWDHYLDSLGNSIGRDGDLVHARSYDGGVSWTDPSALNANAGHDNAPPVFGNQKNHDFSPSVGFDGNGGAVAVWNSSGTLEGALGDDDDIDILYATSTDNCSHLPATGCLVPTRSGAATLMLKNAIGGKDKLRWKWASGEETLLTDFGTPTVSSSYALCLYDKADGSLRNVFELDALAASSCSGLDCWTSSVTGYDYKDAGQQNGPVRALRLKAGDDGDAAVEVRASGPTLAPPVTPLTADPAVVVQLLNIESGVCWEATFATFTRNTADSVKARSE